jgi:Domain of unknown function (DUF4314)
MTNYRPGDRVELLACSDPHTWLMPGDLGTVRLVDDMAPFTSIGTLVPSSA